MSRPTYGPYQLYWGDLHRQTCITCGEGSIRDNFTVCRDEFHMDFCAITDNAYIAEDPADRLQPGPVLASHRHFQGGRAAHSVPLGYWEELTAEVARAHSPGAFVPFLAYEYCSARWGDRNVYYRDASGPLYLPESAYDLVTGALRNGAMVMPHHVDYAQGRRGTDWGVHDSRVERLAEMHSTQHGCSELPAGNRYPLWSNSMGGNAPGGSLTEVLLRGIHIGFNGGTDAHTLRQKPGLTGIWATECTREALWDALWHRRTVATTGARIAVTLTVEGEPQGSALATDRLPLIMISVQSGERLLRVELIRQGEVIRTWHPGGPAFTATLTDDHEPAAPDTWYYVRVTGRGAEMAWSSPIWVSFLPEAPFARDLLYWIPRPRLQWAVVPIDGGWVSYLRHMGCAQDGPIVVTGISGANTGATAGMPVRLDPGEAAERFTPGSVQDPFRLTMREAGGEGEPWTLLRQSPTA